MNLRWIALLACIGISQAEEEDNGLVGSPGDSSRRGFLRSKESLVDRVSQRVCDRVLDIIGRRVISCDCSGAYSRTTGLVTNVVCSLKDQVCVMAENFCGATFSGTYSLEGLQTSQVCIDLDQPNKIDSKIQNFCIEATGSDQIGVYSSCEAKIGSDSCGPCSVCDNGRSFTFDCSAIDISPLPDRSFQGPKLDECKALGFLSDMFGVVTGLASLPDQFDGGDDRVRHLGETNDEAK